MQQSLDQIKMRLIQSLDTNHNIIDMKAVSDVITLLETYPMTKEGLEKSRLGRYINDLRKKIGDRMLAKRAKGLVRTWRSLVELHTNSSENDPDRSCSQPSPPSDMSAECSNDKVDSIHFCRTNNSRSSDVEDDHPALFLESVAKSHSENKRLKGTYELTSSDKTQTFQRNGRPSKGFEASMADQCDSSSRRSIPKPAPSDSKRKKRKLEQDRADSLKENFAPEVKRARVKTTSELLLELTQRVEASSKCVKSEVVSQQSSDQDSKEKLPADPEREELNREELEDSNHRTLNGPVSDNESDQKCCDVDPVDKILSKLPSIDPESIDWDEDPYEACGSNDQGLPGDIVNRISAENLEGINGNMGEDGVFCEWHEPVIRKTKDGESLFMLPYVVLD